MVLVTGPLALTSKPLPLRNTVSREVLEHR